MAATNIPAARPLLAVKFPFVTEDGKEFSDLEKLLTDLGQQSGGYYLLGANNCWHGGIHITDEKFAHHKKKHPVRCMMDGSVIAYRLNKNYPIQQWQAKSTLPATDLKFSNGFCLVRHEYESPANPLTFYSLYMHLADYNTYVADGFPAGTFAPIKKPALPSYWKSRVIGKSKERMRVYRTEQACKNRTTPHDALLNEQQTVTFDAAQVKSATIKGKWLKIALCKIDNAATFAHNTRLNEGWMIVDESQVSWKKVEPTEFDRIVKCNFPIKAGDPIGFMGIWESPADPIGAGATKTKYQMHVELFTTDDKAALDKFLNNDAKLTTGKKYLKVPKGSKLYSSDGHGGFVNPHELLNAARDYVFEESVCTQVKDTANTVFYNIKGIRTGEAATGPVDFAHVKIEGGVKLVTQHDWKELGFTTLEESNNDADGYIDPDKIPSPMFKDIFNRVDGINSRNGQGDGTLTGKEIKDALQQDKDLRNDLYKVIAGHSSEWHSTTQNNMKKLFEEIEAKNTEEEYKNATQFEIDRFLKCEFASQIEGLTQKLWHFHPLVFINNEVKKDYIDRHPIVKCTRRKIGHGRYVYGPLVAGKLTINSSELENYWSDLISAGIVTEREKNIISKMSKNEGNVDAVQSWDSEVVTAGAMQKTVPLNSTSGELNLQINEFKISNPDDFNLFFSSKGWFIENGKLYYQKDSFFVGKKLEDLELQNALRSMCSSDNFGQIVNCEPIANLSNAVSQPVFIKKQLLDFVKRLRKVSKLNVNGYSLDEIFKSDLGLAVALDHHINRPGNVMSHIQSAITNLHQQHNDISTEISLWGSHHANNEAQLLDVYGNNRTDMTDGQKRFENLKQEFTV